MLILKIYRFFTGKVKVSVSGDFVERILNLCAYNGISVWGIRKHNNRLTLYMSVSDFKRMPSIVRQSGIRIHICKKQGIPFIVNRYKYRYGIALGAIMFFVVLQIMSGYIWNISVVGNEKIEAESIISACNEIGIKEGIRASKIYAPNKRVELQTKIDGIAWAALNIDGCELVIDVKESQIAPQKDYSPCNLLSTHDAVIRKIKITEGQIKVNIGDAVAKDGLLVSGVVELNNGNTHLVKSGGEIIGEVSERYTAVVPYKQTKQYLSGDKKHKYVLDFFSLKIPLYLGSNSGKHLKNTEQIVIKNENAYVPVFLHKTTFTPIIERRVTLSEEQALQIARDNIKKRLEGVEIISMQEKITSTDDALTLVCDTVVLKNIIKEQKILIGTTN